MRCSACDKKLTDYEATRRSAESLEYLDLCNECYSYIAEDVPAIDRPDLRSLADEEELRDDLEYD